MTKRIAMFAVVWTLAAGAAWAEPQRPLFTKENAFPGQWHVEVEGFLEYRELVDEDEGLATRDSNILTVEPRLRLGLFDNLALNLALPYVSIDRDFADSDSGIGDIRLGAELLVFQDIFEYPYVIPHAELSFGTGDEDKDLGDGETTATFGVSVGTVVDDPLPLYQKLHFIVDGRYRVASDQENVASVSGSVIWELSPQFMLLAEARLNDRSENAEDDASERPVFFEGGMVFKPVPDLMFGVYGAGAKNTDDDVILTFRVNYSI